MLQLEKNVITQPQQTKNVPVSFPCHHPDVSPFVPEGLGAWVLDSTLLAHAGTAKIK